MRQVGLSDELCGYLNRKRIMDTDTKKVKLERPKKIQHGQFPWESCAPFVENSRGTLIHRPRSVSTYNLHKTGQHVAIFFWCGMGVSSSCKIFTFLSTPPEGRIVCARCEAAAVANSLPSADELAGRHVHKGRTVAVATCCDLTHNA
jgi:hypothetical protein